MKTVRGAGVNILNILESTGPFWPKAAAQVINR
jgi:hypothetical protein